MNDRTKRQPALGRRPSPRWLPLLVFALLGSLVFLRWRTLETRERSILRDKVSVEAAYLATSVDRDLENRIETLHRMAKRWVNRGGTPKDEFLADAAAYFADSEGFQALEWVDPNLVVRWIVPLEGNEKALDMNLSAEARRRGTLDKARSSRSIQATPPLELWQGGKGFLVYLPLHRGESFDGFIVAAFRAEEWLDFVFGVAEYRQGEDFAIALDFDGERLYEQKSWSEARKAGPAARPAAGPAAGFEAKATTLFLGHELAVRVLPTQAFLERNRSRLPFVTALAGLLITILGAGIVRLFQDLSAETRTIEATAKALEAEIGERQKTEAALEAAGRELEARVEERTRSLTAAHARLMEQRQLQNDFETAGQIQADLMSTLLPLVEGFDFSSRAKPSRYVTGDFLDCQLVGDEHCSIMLADITGKGLSAALIASSARSLYRLALNEACGESLEETSAPSRIVGLINAQMLRDLELSERFITMTAARIDLSRGLVEIANAGGCAPLLFDGRDGSCRALDKGGLPVGLFPGLAVETESAWLRPGRGLIIYSDGITEAQNGPGELYGLARLLEAAARNSRLGAEALAAAILKDVEEFQQGLPLSDDLTLFVVKARPRRLRYDFVSSLPSLNEIPLLVARHCAAYGEEIAQALELAVSEILANIREHGYDSKEGPLSLELRLETRGVEVLIKERGEPFDPDSLPPPELGELKEGGFGLHLIRSVTDAFSYQSGGRDGNVWILFKALKS